MAHEICYYSTVQNFSNEVKWQHSTVSTPAFDNTLLSKLEELVFTFQRPPSKHCLKMRWSSVVPRLQNQHFTGFFFIFFIWCQQHISENKICLYILCAGLFPIKDCLTNVYFTQMNQFLRTHNSVFYHLPLRATTINTKWKQPSQRVPHLWFKPFSILFL